VVRICCGTAIALINPETKQLDNSLYKTAIALINPETKQLNNSLCKTAIVLIKPLYQTDRAPT